MNDSPALAGLVVPDFSAPMTGDKVFSLSQARGGVIVLYFYPKDNTPGCSTEAMAFRDAQPDFAAAGATIIGVSRDSIRSHESFKTKLALTFDLISDPDEIVCNQFNVMKIKNMYGKKVRGVERSTFVIDGAGTLVKEWRGVKVPGHVEQILTFVQTIA